MDFKEIVKNSYVANLARLLAYVVHSVWDRIKRSIFGTSGSDVTQNEQQSENFDYEEAVDNRGENCTANVNGTLESDATVIVIGLNFDDNFKVEQKNVDGF